ncbi:MAG: hypothetical protein GY711_15660 [bacterium]|nr:hypothetical protein [bacterium]
MTAHDCLSAWIAARLAGDERVSTWREERRAEIAAGVDDTRFAGLVSLASRFIPRAALAPTDAELEEAEVALAGWNPERWDLLEAARVELILDHARAAGAGFEAALEGAFRYADDGELRALYKSLALLPGGEQFAWQAKEGCRTNIVPVFESIACDNPYPFRHFDDVAWKQLCIKAIFIDAPLWRVWGLDRRLSPDMARMALDLVDERRSAGRDVQHELWLCLGEHGGERGLESLERELAGDRILGRRAAALALARAGRTERLQALVETEGEPTVAQAMRDALEGHHDQGAFRALDPRN